MLLTEKGTLMPTTHYRPIYARIPGTQLYRHEGGCLNGRFLRPFRPSGLKTHAQWMAAPAPRLALVPPLRKQSAPSRLMRDFARFLEDLPYLLTRPQRARRELPPPPPETLRLVTERRDGRINIA